jgi:hypothetical protein
MILSMIKFSYTSLQWFSSYLNDRRQIVSISNTFSDLQQVKSGVPQGNVSVLNQCTWSLFLIHLKPFYFRNTSAKYLLILYFKVFEILESQNENSVL